MTTFAWDCPYCDTKNTAFTIEFAKTHSGTTGESELFAVCNNCHRGIVRTCKSNSGLGVAPLVGPIGNFDAVARGLGFFTNTWRPSKAAIDVPSNLPNDVEKSFYEGCSVIGLSNDGACAMFRKSLDMATKDLSKGEDGVPWKLEKRIDQLSRNGKITKDIAEWAHQIRIDGNDVLHENNASKEDAEALRDLTKYVLTYLYTLPEQVRIAKEKSLKNKPE